MASSLTGKVESDLNELPAIQPLDLLVTLNLQINQFPHDKSQKSLSGVKMTMNKDKLLQLTRDMQEALEIMDNLKSAF